MPINWHILNDTSLFEKGDLTCLADQYVNMYSLLPLVQLHYDIIVSFDTQLVNQSYLSSVCTQLRAS